MFWLPARPPAHYHYPRRHCRHPLPRQLSSIPLPVISPTSVATPTTQKTAPLSPFMIELETVSVSVTEGAPVSLVRTPSEIPMIPTVSINSSIFVTESTIEEYWGEEPTKPSLLSTSRPLMVPRSLTPWPVRYLDPSGSSELTSSQRSPCDIAPLSSHEPSILMSVSITTRIHRSCQSTAN